MNGLLFVFALLFSQVSASFFDRLYSAVSTVDHGFGKLLSNIVSDVKDTVDSTLSVVNDVLGGNGGDKVSTLNHPNVEKSNTSPSNIQTHHHRTFENINKNDVSVNQPSIEAAVESFRKETNRLKEISEILRRELENMSNIAHNELRKVNFNENQVTVESICQQIKNLNELQRKSTNTHERKEVRHVLDKVLNILHLKPKDNETLDTHELENMKKELQKLSNENGERRDSNNHSSQLDVNKPITQENKSSNYKIASNTLNKFDQKDSKNKINNTNDVYKYSKTEKDLHEDKSVFNLNLDKLNYITPFSKSLVSKKDIETAKSIIDKSRRTDKLLKGFFKQKHDSVDLFGNPDLFDFGKR